MNKTLYKIALITSVSLFTLAPVLGATIAPLESGDIPIVEGADANDRIQAIYNKGNAFFHPRDDSKNYNFEEAVRYYYHAAWCGHKDAQYDLGVSLEFGIGVEQNKAAAFALYQLAADQGHAAAKGALIFGEMRRLSHYKAHEPSEELLAMYDGDEEEKLQAYEESKKETEAAIQEANQQLRTIPIEYGDNYHIALPEELTNKTLFEKIDWWQKTFDGYTIAPLVNHHLSIAYSLNEYVNADLFIYESDANKKMKELLEEQKEENEQIKKIDEDFLKKMECRKYVEQYVKKGSVFPESVFPKKVINNYQKISNRPNPLDQPRNKPSSAACLVNNVRKSLNSSRTFDPSVVSSTPQKRKEETPKTPQSGVPLLENYKLSSPGCLIPTVLGLEVKRCIRQEQPHSGSEDNQSRDSQSCFNWAPKPREKKNVSGQSDEVGVDKPGNNEKIDEVLKENFYDEDSDDEDFDDEDSKRKAVSEDDFESYLELNSSLDSSQIKKRSYPEAEDSDDESIPETSQSEMKNFFGSRASTPGSSDSPYVPNEMKDALNFTPTPNNTSANGSTDVPLFSSSMAGDSPVGTPSVNLGEHFEKEQTPKSSSVSQLETGKKLQNELIEKIINGFVLNEEVLKSGKDNLKKINLGSGNCENYEPNLLEVFSTHKQPGFSRHCVPQHDGCAAEHGGVSFLSVTGVGNG